MDPDDLTQIAHNPDVLERFYRAHVEDVQRFVARRVADPYLAQAAGAGLCAALAVAGIIAGFGVVLIARTPPPATVNPSPRGSRKGLPLRDPHSTYLSYVIRRTGRTRAQVWPRPAED